MDDHGNILGIWWIILIYIYIPHGSSRSLRSVTGDGRLCRTSVFGSTGCHSSFVSDWHPVLHGVWFVGLHIDYPPVKLTWLWKPWHMKKEDLPMEMGIFQFAMWQMTREYHISHIPMLLKSLYIFCWGHHDDLIQDSPNSRRETLVKCIGIIGSTPESRSLMVPYYYRGYYGYRARGIGSPVIHLVVWHFSIWKIEDHCAILRIYFDDFNQFQISFKAWWCSVAISNDHKYHNYDDDTMFFLRHGDCSVAFLNMT